MSQRLHTGEPAHPAYPADLFAPDSLRYSFTDPCPRLRRIER